MSKTALLILGPACEEIEVVVPADVLRRCGIKVVIAGLEGDSPVICRCGVVIKPDVALADLADNLYDVVILPGGHDGGPKLAESELVQKIVVKHYKDYRIVATICHSALVFLKAEIGFGRKLTSYPTSKDKLDEYFNYIEEPVVIDGNIITSRAPGTAFAFALSVAEALVGAEVVKEEKKKMLLD